MTLQLVPGGPHPADLDPVLHVLPWEDPVLDVEGHDPRGLYCERYWLPLLGPSATLLLRRLRDLLDEAPDGFSIESEEAARSLGIGVRGGRNSAFARTLRRLMQFRMLHRETGTDVVLARRRLPSLSRSQVSKLPPPLRAEHDRLRDATRVDLADPATAQIRARHLAMSLFDLGNGPGEVERELHRHRFHPAVASSAVRWAHERRLAREA